MLSVDNLEAISRQGEVILERAREDRHRPVPQYPGWTMSDLVAHLGGIHARTRLLCAEQPSERPVTPRPDPGHDVVEWYAANLAGMLSALEAADPETPVWGFWPSSSLGLWERRMVIETGLHRWDADQAFGDPGSLLQHAAVSGLDEFSEMWLPRLGSLPALEMSDVEYGGNWRYGDGEPVTRVSGTASDLYLGLMSRPTPVELPGQWVAALATLDPPPKP